MIVERPNEIKFTLTAEEAVYLKNILFKFAETGESDCHIFAESMANAVGIISYQKEEIKWRK